VGGLAVALIVVLALISGDGRRDQDETRTEIFTDRSGLRWRAIAAPDSSVRPESALAVRNGFVLLTGPARPEAAIFFSADGISWSESGLTKRPYGVVDDDDTLIAFREYEATRLDWDGTDWVEGVTAALPTFARVGYLSGRPAVLVTDDGILVHSVEGELFHSSDGVQFEQVIERGDWWTPNGDAWERFTAPFAGDACRPPAEGSLDYPPMVITGDLMVAFTPLEKSGPNLTWPVCDPELWSSVDGIDWVPSLGDSGFDTGSFVYDVASRSGLHLAVGGRGEQPSVWMSDDGLDWSVVDWSPGGQRVVLTEIAAGEMGFVVLGVTVSGSHRRAWFSRDGACWQPLPEPVAAVAAAVGSDRVVLVDRRPGPELWVGTVDPTGTDLCGDR
jgi:hypothetical protein